MEIPFLNFFIFLKKPMPFAIHRGQLYLIPRSANEETDSLAKQGLDTDVTYLDDLKPCVVL